MNDSLPSGRVIAEVNDGESVENPPPVLRLSKKEAARIASYSGLAPIKLQKAHAFAEIGRYITKLGAKQYQQGAFMASLDQLDKIARFIDVRIGKCSSGESADADLMVKLIDLRLRATEGMIEIAKGVAVGAVKLKDQEGDPVQPGKAVPVLADMGALLAGQGMKLTQTTLEVTKDQDALLSQRAG